MSILEIKNLGASVDGRKILSGVSLNVKSGEVHAIMGPNGSGKSTLAFSLMGRSKYKVESGKILLNGKDISKLSADKRAKLGMFLGLQHPSEVSGVSVFNFLRAAYKAVHCNGKETPIMEFSSIIKKNMKSLKMDESLIGRGLNEGFSGGEKKLGEVLQLSVLEPKIAILDEPDSGADVDALKKISAGIEKAAKNGTGIILITHYSRILNFVKPDRVHILIAGKIVKSGSSRLADEVEKKGYENFRRSGRNEK